MNNDKKGKNIFSFNVRILNNNKNYKKIKDIFIRKQDIYLIKLLEKKAKENKNTRLNTSLKKIIFDENKSSLNDVNKMNSIINKTYDINKPQTHEIYKIHLNKKDEMSQTNDIYNNNEINKFEGRSDARKLFDYKNIRIIKKNLDEDLINDINANTNTNNYNYNYNYNIENTINAQRHNQNTIEEQITSKIYNSDMSRNNKTMLNVQLENIQNNNNFQNNIFNKQHIISERLYDKNNSKKDFLYSKYNKTSFKLIYNQRKNYNIFKPIKIPKNVNKNYNNYVNEIKKSKSNDKFNCLLNDAISSEKSLNIRSNFPMFKKIRNKINFTDNKNEEKLNNELLNSNNRVGKYEKQIEKQKIRKNIYEYVNEKWNLNHSKKIKINYSLKHSSKKSTMENLYNGLPYINKPRYHIE
jgi:hypothetical protein